MSASLEDPNWNQVKEVAGAHAVTVAAVKTREVAAEIALEEAQRVVPQVARTEALAAIEPEVARAASAADRASQAGDASDDAARRAEDAALTTAAVQAGIQVRSALEPTWVLHDKRGDGEDRAVIAQISADMLAFAVLGGQLRYDPETGHSLWERATGDGAAIRLTQTGADLVVGGSVTPIGGGSMAKAAAPPVISRLVAEGDSMTAINVFAVGDAQYYPANGPLVWACALSGQRMSLDPGDVLAVSGSLVSDMVARIPQMVASKADTLVLRPGRNDANAAPTIPLETTLGGISQIVAAAIGAGKRVILHAIGPMAASSWDQSGNQLLRSRDDAAINNHLLRLAREHPQFVSMADAREVTTNPRTGGWVDGASYDGTHEYPITAYRQARALLAVMEPHLLPVTREWVQRYDLRDPAWNPRGNRLANPVLEGAPTTVSSGPLAGSTIPPSWAAGVSGGTLTSGSVSINQELAPEGAMGSGVVLAATAAVGAATAASYYVEQTLTLASGAYAAGETLEATVAALIEGDARGLIGVGIRMIENDGASLVNRMGLNQRYPGHTLPTVLEPIRILDRAPDLTVRPPSGASTITVRLRVDVDLTVAGGADFRVHLFHPCVRTALSS